MKLRTTLLGALLLTSAGLALAGDFSERADVRAFLDEVASRNAISQADMAQLLGHLYREDDALRLIAPPSGKTERSWQSYRRRFVEPFRIREGINFWQENRETVRRASQTYRVSEEILVAIIGVETIYGRNTGNFQTLSTLATLAFDYPKRADLFRRELEALILLARQQHRPAWAYQGSYAGAIGLPQFLPSSVQNFGVDFDGDGSIDLDTSPADAIGSVASYLAAHGWEADAPVARRVALNPGADPQALVDAGIEPVLDAARLNAHGIQVSDTELLGRMSTLVDLPTPGQPTEYWLGYRNFYVITRYNKSSFYAMTVFQLAEALRKGFDTAQARQDQPRR